MWKSAQEKFQCAGCTVMYRKSGVKGILPPDITEDRNNKKGGTYLYQDNVVLCGASAYEQKYYFNKDFDSLPDHVKKELQIMCVLYTEEIGGIFTLEFDDHGNLQFKTEAAEADGFYDDIGGALKIKQLRQEKEELLESLEMYYRVFFLGEDVEAGNQE